MTFMVTSDPMNIHRMFSKNFSNYTKGPKFQEIFDVLEDGIFNSDSDSWRYQRKLLQSLIMHREFESFFQQVVKGKVDKSLIPVLEHISSFGIEVDLQDIFHRFTFDNVCLVALGIDPNCLSIEFPDVSHAKAFEQLEECMIYRHIVPESCWKLQKWLQIGSEKKLSNGWKILDQFIYKCISSRQEEQSQSRAPKTEVEKFNLLTAIGELVEEIGGTAKSDKFLRDTAINLMTAGKDGIGAGLIWFFWIVATHPYVEAKILEEIKEHLFDNGKSKDLNITGLSKLVYLHGAICETLRLFPPIPFEHKFSVQYDILPSGHSIRPNTTILCSLYSMGRMESIWGEDCLDFKPERWISESGGIVHVPSFEFIAFNSGPRTCIGKDIAFIQMKIIASAIICNYHVHVIEGQPISPSISVPLHMKHGLKVRISKRQA